MFAFHIDHVELRCFIESEPSFYLLLTLVTLYFLESLVVCHFTFLGVLYKPLSISHPQASKVYMFPPSNLMTFKEILLVALLFWEVIIQYCWRKCRCSMLKRGHGSQKQKRTMQKRTWTTKIECPKIIAWGKRCMQKECVAESLPDQKKIYLLCN